MVKTRIPEFDRQPLTLIGEANAKNHPFLWYAKEAEEAAAFYASIFPDSRVNRVTSLPSESPSGPPGSVKIVDLLPSASPSPP